jgi:hypothetical protein
MKITIVETEIQEAIRNHLHTIMTLKPGCVITMDFSATRGSDGLIAAIDISPPVAPLAPTYIAPAEQVVDQGSAAEAPVEAAAPVARVTRAYVRKNVVTGTNDAGETASLVNAPADVIGESEVDGLQEATSVETPKSAFSSARAEANAQPDGDGVEEVEGSQPLKRSIFANLSRPVNTPTAEADSQTAVA